jgi:hypothetical protein
MLDQQLAVDLVVQVVAAMVRAVITVTERPEQMVEAVAVAVETPKAEAVLAVLELSLSRIQLLLRLLILLLLLFLEQHVTGPR